MRTLLMLMILASASCIPNTDGLLRDARVAANGAAMAIETSQTIGELAYEVQQTTAVKKAMEKEGATKTSVRAAVEEVRTKWAPVRKLFTEAREVHSKLVMAIEAGETAAIVLKLMESLWNKTQGITEQLKELRGG